MTGIQCLATDWDGDGLDDVMCRVGDDIDIYLGSDDGPFEHWLLWRQAADLNDDGVDDVFHAHAQVSNGYVLRVFVSDP